jgi:hypothetical protein
MQIRFPNRSFRLYSLATLTSFLLGTSTLLAQPANDECVGSIELPVNPGITCSPLEVNTTTATNSFGTYCYGSNDDDVWFRFTATGDHHLVLFSDITNPDQNYVSTVVAVLWTGECDNSLVAQYCTYFSGSGYMNLGGLTPGTNYYLQAYSYDFQQPVTFGLCVLTLPPSGPPNDDCANAVELAVSPDLNYTLIEGTTLSATLSSGQPGCAGTSDDDVWYSFTATHPNHTLVMEDIKESITGLEVGYEVMLFKGDCNSNELLFCNVDVGNASQTFTGLTPGDQYFIKVHSIDAGVALNFKLALNTPPVPANDECSGAIELTVNSSLVCATSLNGSTLGTVQDENSCFYGNKGPGVWYKFTATDDVHWVQMKDVKAISSIGNVQPYAIIEALSGVCGNFTSFLCTNVYNTGTVKLENLVPGEVYYLKVSSNYSFDNFSFNLCVKTEGPPLSNDACSTATPLTIDAEGECDSPVLGTTDGATPSEPANCYGFTEGGAWYSFVATQTAHLFSITNVEALIGVEPLAIIEIFGGDCNALSPIHCFNAYFSTTALKGDFVPGQTYYLRVTPYHFEHELSFNLCIGAPPVAPPANDACVAAISLTPDADNVCDNPVTGSISNATESPRPANSCFGLAPDVWYSFTATSTAHRVQVSNIKNSSAANSYLNIEVFSGACGNLNRLTCSTFYSEGTTEATEALTPGETYYLRIFPTYPDESITFDLCVLTYFPPANDQCVNAQVLTPAVGETCDNWVAGTNASALPSHSINTCSGNPSGDVWYQFTAISTAHYINFSDIRRVGTNDCEPLAVELYADCASNSAPVCRTLACAGSATMANLTPGNSYSFRVLGLNYYSDIEYNICISTPDIPDNDLCSGAVELIPDADLICDNVTSGSTQNAFTGSEQSNCSSPGFDVWYKFQATSGAHRIALSNVLLVNGGYCSPASLEVYSGNCENTDLLGCLPATCDGKMDIGGLTPGEYYYVRVMDYYYNPFSFDLCVLTLPPPPANDACANATTLVANPYQDCASTVAGTTQNATPEWTYNACAGQFNSVWYQFTATHPYMIVKLDNIQSQGGAGNVALDFYNTACANNNLPYLCNYFFESGTQILTGLTPGTVYYFRVQEVNGLGPVTFDVCLQSPPAPPANDLCTNAVVLTPDADLNCDTYTMGTNLFANSESFSGCFANPYPDVWYQFTATATIHELNVTDIFTTGTNNCNYLKYEIYAGNCEDGLSNIFCNDIYCGYSQPLTNLTPGQTYFIRVASNQYDAFVDFKICITTPPVPVNDLCSGAIELMPSSDLSCNNYTPGSTQYAYTTQPTPYCYYYYNGNDVWYKFTATSLAHRVQLSGINSIDYGGCGEAIVAFLSGTCDDNLNLLGCKGISCDGTADFGGLTPGETYHVRISGNYYAKINFGICILTLPDPPANDVCQGAVALTANQPGVCALIASGSTLGATPEWNDQSCAGALNSVWYQFTATSSTMFLKLDNIVDGNGQNTNIIVEFLAGTCENKSSFICDYPNGNYTRLLENLQVGLTYLVRVFSNNPLPVSFDICLQLPPPPPANDECAGAFVLPVETGATCDNYTNGTTYFAGSNNYYAGCFGTYPDVWYKFTATSRVHEFSFKDVFTTGTSDCQNYLYVEVGSGNCSEGFSPFSCQYIFCNQSFTATNFVPGQEYYLRMGGNAPSVFLDFKVCISTPLQTANDECANAIELTPSPDGACVSPISGTNANTYFNDYQSCGQNFPDVWYKFTATSVAHKISLTNVFVSDGYCHYAEIGLFSGDCGSLNLVQCGYSGYCESYITTGDLTPGQTYYVRVSAYYPITFDICVTTLPTPPANDLCANAQTLAVNTEVCNYTTSGTTLNALLSLSDPYPCYGQYPNVWYTFTATNASHILEVTNLVNLNAPGDYTSLQVNVYNGTCGSNFYSLACWATDGQIELPMLNLSPGSVYTVAVSETTFGPASFDICVRTVQPPANDACANAQEALVNVDIYCAMYNHGTTFGAALSDPGCSGNTNLDVWYRFTATSQSYDFTFLNIQMLYGATYQTGFEIYSGSCGNLNSLGCRTDYGDFILGGFNTGEEYYVRVFTVDGAVANFDLCIRALPAPPANDECAGAIPAFINSDLNCQTLNYGSTLGATSSGLSTCLGTPPVFDVWYSFEATSENLMVDVTPLSGIGYGQIGYEIYSGDCSSPVSIFCPASVYSSAILTSLSPGETYYLRIYTFNHSMLDFQFCIRTLPPTPANDLCENAITIVPGTSEACESPVSGTTASATQSAENLFYCVSGSDVWYKFVATGTSHTLFFDNVQIVYGGYYNIAYTVMQGDCSNGFNSLGCFYWYYGATQVISGLTPGEIYYVVVTSSIDSGFNFDLCMGTVPPPPANDLCENAVVVPTNPDMNCENSISGTTSGAIDNDLYLGCGQYRDVWYQFTATSSSHLIRLQNVITKLGYENDIRMDLYAGTCPNGLQPIFTCQNAASGIEAMGILTIGETYYIRVHEIGFYSAHDYDLCILTLPPSPVNDECDGAIELPVSASEVCSEKVAGSTLGSTSSNYYCTGSDVWYKFTATGTEHKIWIENQQNIYGNGFLYFDVYNGDCNTMNNMTYCFPAYFAFYGYEMGGFTPGTTYYIRVYSNFGSANQFDLCITPSNKNVALLSIFPEVTCAPGSNAKVRLAYQNTGNIALPAGAVSSLITVGNYSYGNVTNSVEVLPGEKDTLVYTGVDLSVAGTVGFEALIQLAGDEYFYDDFLLLNHDIDSGLKYRDSDGDGFGDPAMSQISCEPLTGFVDNADDCNDSNANIKPGAVEICNSIDDDCDGVVDNGIIYNGNVTFTTQAQVDAWPPCYSIINGNLIIKNAGISSITKLNKIVQVTGNVTIQSTRLLSLSGLNSLTTIGGDLFIVKNNARLASLNGLHHLTSLGGNLQLTMNTKLTNCCAIHDLLNTPGGIGGSVSISNNKMGCDNIEQINTNCDGSILVLSSKLVKHKINIAPNPTSGVFYLRMASEFENGHVRLFDLQGRLLMERELDPADATVRMEPQSLRPGVYFVKVILDGELLTEKLVVE